MKSKHQLAIASLMTVGALMMTAQPIAAATSSSTPIAPWRYDKKTTTYRDKSTSPYYKDVWRQATKNWQKQGFKWQSTKNSSKTTLTSYADSSAKGVVYIGMKQTTYTASGRIIKNKVMLNRASFQKFKYNKTERVKVAEHELGHALGLAHNQRGSVSVMNPANRSYAIKGVDVKGMQRRYQTPYKTVTNDTVYVANSSLKANPYLEIQTVFGHDHDCEEASQFTLTPF
ncbi:matrixin family metalloprotease [Lactiplantibacillus songbeiensis]|uniref:Matrixin family metalloprotease n=1 Tax=Lactiplantibacillus songbeiensis TaxID=2559920 RepID=A0ABW4C2K9_9LACO|nr:matrixin family metalloprotease [Lactiplantibacillus songbeiensis]